MLQVHQAAPMSMIDQRDRVPDPQAAGFQAG
jgi:hypothetical protein